MPSTTAAQQALETQQGVATRAQLVAAGHTDSAIRANVRARRWRQLTPRLFVLHNGPLTQRQEWWAATLAVGPLAGRTALEAWGVERCSGEGVEVLVRRGQRFARPQGVPLVVHESRRFEHAHVHPTRRPRLVTVERAAVDAAAWTKDARKACGVLAAVVQQRKTVAPRLLVELAAAGAVRHASVLRAVLHDIAGGADALSEVDLAGVCRRYGLVVSGRQVVRVDSQGRRRYLDARVSAPGGGSVMVEVDGALHLLVASYWEDMRRLNELVIGGDRVLRFPSVAFHVDTETVGNQLRRGCGLDPLHLVA